MFDINIVSNETEEIYKLTKLSGKKKILICSDEDKSLRLLNDAKTFFSDALYFPPKDIFYYSSDVAGTDLIEQRLKVIEKITQNNELLIITTIEAAVEKIGNIDDFMNKVIRLKLGDTVSLKEIIEKLSESGYERYSKVEEKGRYAIRGSILDVYSYTMDYPIRIEFFDDEVDSIREFDIENQRSLKNLDECEIFVANDNINSEKGISLLNISENRDVSLAIDEPNDVYESLNKLYDLYSDEGDTFLFEYEVNNILNKNVDIAFSSTDISSDNGEITGYTLPSYDGKIYKMISDIKKWLKEGYFISIYTASLSRGRRIVEEFTENGIIAELNAGNIEGKVNIVINSIQNSFCLINSKEIFISDTDIFKKINIKRNKKKKREDAQEIQNFSELKIGDIVVHEKYGIGIYKGIENIALNGIKKDYITIEYKNNSALHILATNFSSIQKYIGKSENIVINDLNSTRWAKNKAKVRKNLEIIAKDLIELYAKRQNEKGYSFSKDCELQKEMEELFEFVETEDQLQAIKEIKADMESSKVMDRLLCGDVGFGKTEVAMRAAFKAVLDNKQVAVLVPTTILAKQHYDVFRKRFKNFPVNISMISRFVTKKNQRTIINDVNNGKCDILIGTHAILRDDILYKDLGLLIVDEEQRFGVRHKDKIKKIKNNVDVLTLSATPIPRTLHMSINGIRDLSLLNEPPYDRQAIQTYVMQYDENLIREAILREVKRGGQVYFLHNKVENIDEIANKIKCILPNINVAVVHGKLNKHEIEDIFFAFNNNEIDVLVATTIVETGLDIPNVNTIIINNADKFGLSTLYQLKGRVGRSSKKAYAFLTYPKGKNLSAVSAERLKAIREFSKLGSGAKIAMRDMEIRGTGSILGNVQHGHIESVGYDMYCKILRDTIHELSGEAVSDKIETIIDIDVSTYIDSDYIPTEAEKLEIYKKINTIENNDDYQDVCDECIDRFGDIPESVMNVIKLSYIKNMAESLGIESIIQKGKNIEIKFSEKTYIDSKKFVEYVENNTEKLRYMGGYKKILEINTGNNVEQIKCSMENLINFR